MGAGRAGGCGSVCGGGGLRPPRTAGRSSGASGGSIPGTAGVSWECLNTDIKRQSGFGTPPLVGVGCWVSWSFQGWGWGAGVSREGVRLVKGRVGCRRPVCSHPEERGVASPAQLFVCVHTALACVGGAGRGGDRPRRSGDARGPDCPVNRPASPLAVPVGLLVMCVSARARAPGLLGLGVLRLCDRGAPAVCVCAESAREFRARGGAGDSPCLPPRPHAP